MTKQLRRLSLLLIATGTSFTHWACDPCSTNKGVFVFDESRGAWQLVRVESPTGTQSQFPEPQTLTIALEPVMYSAAVNRETFRSDTTTVKKIEWDTVDENCREESFVVTYDNRQQRKYWISGQTLRATGYVDEVGGKADTLMYFYERVP